MGSYTANLVETLDAVDASTLDGDDASRLQLAMAARKLFHKLETKEEKTIRLAIEEPVVFSAIQALIDVGLWEDWTGAGGGEKTIEDLATITKKDIDPELLRHLLRLLATNHVVLEAGEDRYAPTAFSLSMGDKSTLVAPALRIRTDHIAQCAHHFPEFLANTNYRKPLDDNASCYIDTFPEKKNFWERCKANPMHQESFSSFMLLWGKHKRPWPQFYDTKALLEGADLSDGSAFIVDIGGHHGVDLLRVLDKHPDVPAGSLVLEDLPEVITSVSLATDKIKVIKHSFFEPQPVKGSRAYYLHAVLHDWSDKVSIDILKNVAAAMKPGYSKVLIHDIVLPATGTTCYQAALDCLVMQASANERTEAVWNKVLAEAGLKLLKLWPDGRGYESLIEAELA
ncbi:O-methyltransferase [Pochonia chlamydosporia 170]|uniref:O-methyltransferase n=1 Tax=Pochonia chlamydosporia 170 TaxID=1380566 RepID=A0A179FB30_METCM|nr:O-methyltransferase [Pochonia chlamydosporia 170]OAQ62672.1 O-methyltransferase [Pochonia chlamydosporia 170]